ncbi:MAG: MraY family glycosyltransferase [Fibrobacterota bacterium]
MDVNVAAKFIAQIGAAVVTVCFFDIYIEQIYFLGYTLDLSLTGKLITIIWIVGVTNSFNIIDGIDGLSASLSLLTLFIATFIIIITGDTSILYISLPLAGVILGFLYHNYPPAKIFAGDSGSLFFGYIAAVFSVKISGMEYNGHPVNTAAVLLVVGLPVIEVFISMVRRFWYGLNENRGIKNSIKKVVSPDNLHMHHRLIFRGLNHEQALRFLVFFGLSLSSISIILVLTENYILKTASLLYLIFIIFMVLRRLEYGKSILRYSTDEDSDVFRKNIAVISNNNYFENSLRFYTENKYWITNFSSITGLKRKYFDFFIIYRDKKMNTDTITESVDYIEKKYDKPVFIIDTGTELSPLVSAYQRVYIIKKPVDIPYLIHDMEIIEKQLYGAHFSKIIKGTLSIEGCTDTEC